MSKVRLFEQPNESNLTLRVNALLARKRLLYDD
jgi:hypothetical protein